MKNTIMFLSIFLCSLAFGQVVTTDSGGTMTVGPGNTLERAAGALTTLFASNNAFAGNTFDVTSIKNVGITGFDINLSDQGSGPHTISIYYRLGTSVGSENTPGAWTLLGTDTGVISAGDNNPTPVDVGGLALSPGQVYGIYVDFESYSGGPSIGYTNGGPNVYTDGTLTVTTNTGQAAPTFSGSFFPREWNGTIHYAESVPTLGTVGLITMAILLAGAMILIRRRNAA